MIKLSDLKKNKNIIKIVIPGCIIILLFLLCIFRCSCKTGSSKNLTEISEDKNSSDSAEKKSSSADKKSSGVDKNSSGTEEKKSSVDKNFPGAEKNSGAVEELSDRENFPDSEELC